MSTATNSPEVEEEESNILLVDDKEILAQTISLRNAFQEISWTNANDVCRYSLYGILRSKLVVKMNVTITDPMFILIEFSDGRKGMYRIGWEEYAKFLQEFCRNKRKKVNWKKEGF